MSSWERVRLRIETVKEAISPECSISTHILDTALGRGAANVPVTLYAQSEHNSNEWQLLAQAATDADGRIKHLPSEEEEKEKRPAKVQPIAASRIYKLHFEVKAYFSAQQLHAFYPYIDVVVECVPGQHYHVPLLLTPFGYTTYRGT